MIAVGDYLVRPDGKTFRVMRVDCPDHGGINEARIIADCGNDHIVDLEMVCAHCPQPVVMVAIPAERPAFSRELDPITPLTSPERTDS